jgi:hypothetical protein
LSSSSSSDLDFFDGNRSMERQLKIKLSYLKAKEKQVSMLRRMTLRLNPREL